MFRFFYRGDPFSQAAKSLAWGAFITGLLLIGFGMLVFILRDLFAFLAAAIFFLAGFSAIGYAVRLMIARHTMKNSDNLYRDNVEIHFDDEFDR
ncbi:MAG TPA: hypothetical protein ENN97_09690 [Phycisphaerales bacterium]|nr:hypothetical protein [Phycisphaerales bacterium]